MTVAYPGLFQEKVLPALEIIFREKPVTVYEESEDRLCWYFKNKLVAISEGRALCTGLVWIADDRIPVSLSADISSLQHKAHNEMILRERQAAERIWARVLADRAAKEDPVDPKLAEAAYLQAGMEPPSSKGVK